MAERMVWVWYSKDATDEDVSRWRAIKKIIVLGQTDNVSIIEIDDDTELSKQNELLTQDGFEIDHTSTANDNPRLNCWKISD